MLSRSLYRRISTGRQNFLIIVGSNSQFFYKNTKDSCTHLKIPTHPKLILREWKKMILLVFLGFSYILPLAQCSSDKYHWRNLTPSHHTNTHLKWRYRPYRYGGYVKSFTTTTEAPAADSSKRLKNKKDFQKYQYQYKFFLRFSIITFNFRGQFCSNASNALRKSGW